MEKEKLRIYLFLIVFTIGLVLIVVHFETIFQGIVFLLNLLSPLFIGIVIAFVLNQPYEWFRKRYRQLFKNKEKIAKILAIVTVYCLTCGFIVLLIGMVVPELVQNLKRFAASADQYLLSTQNAVNDVTGDFGLYKIDLSLLMDKIDQYMGSVSNAIDGMLTQIVEITGSVISVTVNAFIALVLSVYLLSGKEKLLMQTKRALRVYLPQRIYGRLSNMFQIVLQVFGDYVVGQCIEAVILGVLCFIGMTILRLDYAALISAVIGVTALIPMLGAYIGGAVGVSLLLFVSPAKAVLFLVFLIILQQIEGNMIYPRVVGRKIGLPGMWVLLGITVGGGIMGIWGMLIAVPITTILYQLLKRDVKKREEKN